MRSLFQSEYHYEYTACDSAGSRWRVAVPHTPGLCTGLPDPVKGTECCKVGVQERRGGLWMISRGKSLSLIHI